MSSNPGEGSGQSVGAGTAQLSSLNFSSGSELGPLQLNTKSIVHTTLERALLGETTNLGTWFV